MLFCTWSCTSTSVPTFPMRVSFRSLLCSYWDYCSLSLGRAHSWFFFVLSYESSFSHIYCFSSWLTPVSSLYPDKRWMQDRRWMQVKHFETFLWENAFILFLRVGNSFVVHSFKTKPFKKKKKAWKLCVYGRTCPLMGIATRRANPVETQFIIREPSKITVYISFLVGYWVFPHKILSISYTKRERRMMVSCLITN